MSDLVLGRNVRKVDRPAAIAVQAGTRNVEWRGQEDARHYAVLFEHPSSYRVKMCFRKRQ